MSPPPSHIAVLRFGAVGDVLLTTPALEALRQAFPVAQITYVTKAALASIVSANPHIDNLLTFESGESAAVIAKRLRQAKVDTVVDWHDKLRSKLVRWLLPGTRRVVWSKRPFGVGLPVRLGLKTWRPTRLLSSRYHAAVEKLAGKSLAAGELRAFPTAAGRGEAQRLLQRLQTDKTRPLLGLSPGANWLTKRWPSENFGRLASVATAAGWQVVVTGSEAERPLFDELCRLAPECKSAIGTSLGGLVGIIEQCDAFVANDSGPMHIARGLGVPTVALFGSTPPSQFDFSGHTLLFERQPCAPCHFYGRKRCPKGHLRCMKVLRPEAAWAALEQVRPGTRLPLVSG